MNAGSYPFVVLAQLDFGEVGDCGLPDVRAVGADDDAPTVTEEQYRMFARAGNVEPGHVFYTGHEIPGASDKTCMIQGTFSSATVVLQGSMDNTTWLTLADPQGNAISKTAAAIEAVLDNPRYIRPTTSGGSGTDLDVYLLCRTTR